MNVTASLDVELARHNMVEQQIRPWNVLDQRVLDTLMAVPREAFVPPAHRALAFSDTEIPLDIDGVRTGEVMFEPRVEARFLQALAPARHETVVEVGAGSGYMAALLAHRGGRVASYEIRPELAAFARDNLARAAVANCEILARSGADLLTDKSWQADVIMLSGAVDAIPEALLERLRPGGRLAAVVGSGSIMEARIVRLSGRREPMVETLFETVAKPLTGFPAADRFRF